VAFCATGADVVLIYANNTDVGFVASIAAAIETTSIPCSVAKLKELQDKLHFIHPAAP
jgi:hypothetical protein